MHPSNKQSSGTHSHITAPRLFVPDDLHRDAAVTLSTAHAHYLGTVMREKPGAALRLFNGRDGEYLARITAIRRDRASVAVEHQLHGQLAEPDLWLAFAPLKRDATDMVVQKATELGASAILPVFTARTNAARLNTDRLLAIAIEAAEQCERLTVPRMAAPQRLGEFLAGWPSGRPLFAAIERVQAAGMGPHVGPAGLLIGPEGGFAPDELELLARQPDVTGVSFGARVLRAETAAIVGLALLQSQIGR